MRHNRIRSADCMSFDGLARFKLREYLRNMKRIVLRLCLLSFGVLAFVHSPCSAQQLSPISFEANVGMGLGGGSAPYGSSGASLSADALFGFRVAQLGSASLVIAASGSGQAPGVHVASCDALPGGSCSPDFPVFWIVSTLVGLETAHGGARILVGPAVAISSSQRVRAGQVRLDLAKPLVPHVSLLMSARFAYVPEYRGSSFSLGAAGVGLRLR